MTKTLNQGATNIFKLKKKVVFCEAAIAPSSPSIGQTTHIFDSCLHFELSITSVNL